MRHDMTMGALHSSMQTDLNRGLGRRAEVDLAGGAGRVFLGELVVELHVVLGTRGDIEADAGYGAQPLDGGVGPAQ